MITEIYKGAEINTYDIETEAFPAYVVAYQCRYFVECVQKDQIKRGYITDVPDLAVAALKRSVDYRWILLLCQEAEEQAKNKRKKLEREAAEDSKTLRED